MSKVQLKLEHPVGNVEFVEVDPDNDLMIDENNLEAEACRQIQLMVEYGRIWSVTKSASLAADGEIKITEAIVAAAFRQDCAKMGKKVTEGAITEHVQSHPDYIQAIQSRVNASVIAALTYSWWATVQQRAEMLKLIGYRQNTEIKYGE